MRSEYNSHPMLKIGNVELSHWGKENGGDDTRQSTAYVATGAIERWIWQDPGTNHPHEKGKYLEAEAEPTKQHHPGETDWSIGRWWDQILQYMLGDQLYYSS